MRFWSTDFYRETAEKRRQLLFQPRAAFVAEAADRFHASARSIADIGSGYGIFLEEIARTGRFAEVVGIEPNATMADVCRERGFAIIEDSLEHVQDQRRFDMLTCFEVLEHVFDPRDFLASALALLEPEGVLIFTTLVGSGFDIQVLWEHSKSASPPHHLNLMSVKGIRTVLERAGFEVLELTTPGQLDVEIVSGALRENPAISVPRFVKSLLNDAETASAFQEFLVRNNVSSHVRVVARRPSGAKSEGEHSRSTPPY